MIETVVRFERSGFFTGGNSGVPRAEFEMSAAEQVVVFGSGRSVDLLFESLDVYKRQRCGAIERSRFHAAQSLLHVVEAVDVAIESGEIYPGTRASMTGIDAGAIFPLRCDVVFASLRDARAHPMCNGWIQWCDQSRLGARFVFAPADDRGSLQIKLGEIGAGLPICGR